jgi:hypothetical protein
MVAFLNQIGTYATSELGQWLIGAVVGTISAIIGFAVAALFINAVGRTVYQADVTFDELVRTLRLPSVRRLIGVLGVVAILGEGLSCIVELVTFVAWGLMLYAWSVAAKETLDLDLQKTAYTLLLGCLALIAVIFVADLVLGLLGFRPAGWGGLFRSWITGNWALSD